MLIDEITKTATAAPASDTTPTADTATVSTPPSEVKPEPVKKKPDIIDNDTARLLTDRLLNATRLKKPSKPAEEPKKEPEPAPAEEKKPESEAKKPAKKPAEAKAEPKPEPLDYERIGKEVGKAVREATKPEERGAEAPPEQAQPDEAKTIRYLERMEQANPEKYKGIASKYSTGLKQSAEYQAKWEKENPGEKFDKADPQHDAFFEKNAVDWDDKDYIEAVADLKADERTQKIRDEFAAKDRAARLEPEVRKASAETTRSLLEDVGGKDAASAINPDGSIDPEKWKAFAEAEPTKAEVLQRAALASRSITAEVENLFNGTVKFDPSNKLHSDISNFALAAERSMLSQSEAARTQDGKVFVDAKTYSGMSARERAQHWTFTARDLRFLAAQDIKADAEKEIAAREEQFSQWAKRRGMSKRLDATEENESKKDAKEQAKTASKPVSPTTTVEPKMASRVGNAVSTKEEAELRWKERYIGRKLAV